MAAQKKPSKDALAVAESVRKKFTPTCKKVREILPDLLEGLLAGSLGGKKNETRRALAAWTVEAGRSWPFDVRVAASIQGGEIRSIALSLDPEEVKKPATAWASWEVAGWKKRGGRNATWATTFGATPELPEKLRACADFTLDELKQILAYVQAREKAQEGSRKKGGSGGSTQTRKRDRSQPQKQEQSGGSSSSSSSPSGNTRRRTRSAATTSASSTSNANASLLPKGYKLPSKKRICEGVDLGLPTFSGDDERLTKAAKFSKSRPPTLGEPVAYKTKENRWVIGFYTGIGKSGINAGKPTARRRYPVKGGRAAAFEWSDSRRLPEEVVERLKTASEAFNAHCNAEASDSSGKTGAGGKKTQRRKRTPRVVSADDVLTAFP